MMASPSSCTSRRDNEAHMTEKIAKDVSDKLKATSSRDFYVMDMVVPEMQSALDLDKKEALEKSLEALEMGLQALNAMRNNLLQRVYKEEGRGLPVLSEVKKWISDVEEIESKANPLLDKSISELHKLSKSEDGSQISEPTPNHYSEMVHQRLKEVETLKTKEFSEFVVDRAHLLHVRKILPLQPTLDKITLETKRLSPEESWDLFQEVVGEATLTSHPDIRQLARIVAKKCGGFCFALYLIGVTMSSKRTTREWYHAIHVLVSSAAEFSDMKDKILPILKFSYDSLPCENIRLCFLYCALFPEGDVTSKQGLVDCLIGEGIIADEEDREIAEIKGYEVIETLVKMFLLMEDESGYGVKMHDVVREMALWIASDFGKQKEHFVVVGGERIHQMPEVNDWRMVRRMSVTSTQIQNISESPDHSKLTTLFLKENNNLKCISGDFFRWMKSLLLLDLSNNKELADLPEEVSCLVSLQFLNLSFTSITRLPLGLKELKKLIHLDLEHTSKLKEIEVIAGLSSLQVLRLFWSFPMDLGLMEDLLIFKGLKELSLNVEEDAVLQRLLSDNQLASCIRRLHLNGFTITNGGISLLNSASSIRELSISGCNFPKITTDRRRALHFSNIEQCPQFRNMHTVQLHGCKGVRSLTWLLLAPNLDNLRVYECPQIEEIISKDKSMTQQLGVGDNSEQPFLNLTSLILEGLPDLKSIYWTPLTFPVLKSIQISRCPKLRRRPVYSDIDNGIRWDLVDEREEEAVETPRWHNQRVIPAVGAVESLQSEQLEDALAEQRVLQRKLEAMVSKEREAAVRFEQLKSQLRRAGRTFAQGLLPFEPSDQHYLDQRGIVPVGRGSRETTISVRYDELQAALVRLSMTRAYLEKATSRERELRINIEQAENQLVLWESDLLKVCFHPPHQQPTEAAGSHRLAH